MLICVGVRNALYTCLAVDDESHFARGKCVTRLDGKVVIRQVPKVALLVETSRGFGREFVLGIARYSRLHGPWSFHITPGDYKQVVPKMQQWGGTGIIARI